MTFVQSSAGIVTVFLASMASTEAAYGHMYMGSRPSMALGPRMLPARSGRPPLFSQDIVRTLHDFDNNMFDFVLGDLNEVFYTAFPWKPSSKPLYLLPGSSLLNDLVQGKARSKDLVKDAHRITQDEQQLQIVVDVPDLKAGNINIQLEENGRVLKISGETNFQEKAISVQSRFEKSFLLPRNVNMSEISAEMDRGVLTITAPKFVVDKESVRQIDIVKTEEATSEEMVEKRDEVNASASGEEGQKSKADVLDEPEMIDLDVEQK